MYPVTITFSIKNAHKLNLTNLKLKTLMPLALEHSIKSYNIIMDCRSEALIDLGGVYDSFSFLPMLGRAHKS